MPESATISRVGQVEVSLLSRYHLSRPKLEDVVELVEGCSLVGLAQGLDETSPQIPPPLVVLVLLVHRLSLQVHQVEPVLQVA